MWIIRIRRALRDSFAAWGERKSDFDEKCSRLRGKGKDVEYGISNRFGIIARFFLALLGYRWL